MEEDGTEYLSLTTYSYDCLSLEQHRSLNLELCLEILLIYRNL